MQVKPAKIVTAGLVLPISSLVQAPLPDPMAGLAKVLHDPSTLPHTVLQAEAVVIFEAAAIAEEEEVVVVAEAIVEVLPAALAMDSGRMACTLQGHRI